LVNQQPSEWVPGKEVDGAEAVFPIVCIDYIAATVILWQTKEIAQWYGENPAKEHPINAGMGYHGKVDIMACCKAFENGPATVKKAVKAFSVSRAEACEVLSPCGILAGKTVGDLADSHPLPISQIDFGKIRNDFHGGTVQVGAENCRAFPTPKKRAGQDFSDGL
jgi:hypothetical protein